MSITYKSPLQAVVTKVVKANTDELIEEYKDVVNFPQALEFVATVAAGAVAASGRDSGSGWSVGLDPDQAAKYAFEVLEAAVKLYQEKYFLTTQVSQSMLDQMAQSAATGTLGRGAALEVVSDKTEVTIQETQKEN